MSAAVLSEREFLILCDCLVLLDNHIVNELHTSPASATTETSKDVKSQSDSEHSAAPYSVATTGTLSNTQPPNGSRPHPSVESVDISNDLTFDMNRKEQKKNYWQLDHTHPVLRVQPRAVAVCGRLPCGFHRASVVSCQETARFLAGAVSVRSSVTTLCECTSMIV